MVQSILSTPTRCKDAKEWKEKLTAWSLKVAEYEHQFKVIDDAQRTFVMGEMMPKDMEIIINEMMADNGTVPMDLGSVGTHDAKMTHSDSETSNDMSYDDVCAIAWQR